MSIPESSDARNRRSLTSMMDVSFRMDLSRSSSSSFGCTGSAFLSSCSAVARLFRRTSSFMERRISSISSSRDCFFGMSAAFRSALFFSAFAAWFLFRLRTAYTAKAAAAMSAIVPP